ncbi:concanavalin A-like lectin/glucanase domain-containing protein [Lophiotrema nucula]|uniref:Concanavalin A-like lectin/glucanase domain-containing protein n=1 Tax=Lophiotrema nucula TaxID=690887 RepID=A0A6A5YNZ0_9PLEO|nr:concanavalin A-like lectin/glucanase domain-containing protein [Lophiotrema nucula]
MYISSKALQTIAWSSLAFSAARASYIIDNLSFGHKDGQPLSPNLRGIPHWAANGFDYSPEILSDRVILTPPWPGNRRGSLWSEDPLHHNGDWIAELSFRANGMERGQGNLQLWYTKDSQKVQTPNSLYTISKFDGLVLVVDQYEGRGGTVRGFLNDGNIDFKGHHSVDTLSFGQCNYAYRNRGEFSVLELKQANGELTVTVDKQACFSTNKVKLPEGNYFGLSASSAENPDSFEISKFTVATTNAYTREEPNRQPNQPASPHQDQHQQPIQKQPPLSPQQAETQQMMADVLAASIKSQDDRFADTHNRLQNLMHQVTTFHDYVARVDAENHDRYNNLMNKIVAIDDKINAMLRNVEKVERTSMEVQRDLESKDFKDMLNTVHRAIEDSHSSLSAGMPAAMAQIAGKERPSMTTFLFIAVAVQVMILGGYIVYKKRRRGAPKKYL